MFHNRNPPHVPIIPLLALPPPKNVPFHTKSEKSRLIQQKPSPYFLNGVGIWQVTNSPPYLLKKTCSDQSKPVKKGRTHVILKEIIHG